MKMVVILIPVIGGITGWLVVVISLKLLFWPEKPLKLPFISIWLHGLVPLMRDQLEAGVREIVETQILHAVAGSSGTAPDLLNKLADTVVVAARERTEVRLPALLPRGIKDKIKGVVEDTIRKEFPPLVDSLVDTLRDKQSCGIDFYEIIEAKIRAYDLRELHFRTLRAKEVRYLKILAGAIGVCSGLVQLLVLTLTQY